MGKRWSGNSKGAGSTLSPSSNASRRCERGAALVELAFALPILIMLLVGMVSAGIAYNHQLALTHAAREGGRYAATLPVNGMEAWLDTIIDQTVVDATGTLDAGVPGRSVCVAYVYPEGTQADDSTAMKELGGTMVTDGTTCFSDGRPDQERRVQVVVGRETEFTVVFFGTTVDLDAEAVNRFEAAQ